MILTGKHLTLSVDWEEGAAEGGEEGKCAVDGLGLGGGSRERRRRAGMQVVRRDGEVSFLCPGRLFRDSELDIGGFRMWVGKDGPGA